MGFVDISKVTTPMATHGNEKVNMNYSQTNMKMSHLDYETLKHAAHLCGTHKIFNGIFKECNL